MVNIKRVIQLVVPYLKTGDKNILNFINVFYLRRAIGYDGMDHLVALVSDRSSGHRASGHRASGHRASGHRASGHRASGHHDSGHRASGHRASGHRASGQSLDSKTGSV